jgi:hypothetical protein
MRGLFATTALVALLCGSAASAIAQQPIGDFYFFPRTDPGTGDDRSSITTLADESYTSGAGGLTFQCRENGLTLIISASYLGRTMSTQVRYSFGDEGLSAAAWPVRSTGMAAIAPEDVRNAFLEEAVGHSSVVFYVSDFQLRRHTYTFHLTSLDSALAQLSCS